MQKLVKKVTTVVEEFVDEAEVPANGQSVPIEKCFEGAANGKEIRYAVESNEELDDVDEDLDEDDEEEEVPAKGRGRR